MSPDARTSLVLFGTLFIFVLVAVDLWKWSTDADSTDQKPPFIAAAKLLLWAVVFVLLTFIQC